ncbi:MAG: alpha/beta hydrolase fold domain-containing protein [Chitinophagaceae bacterium]|nr:alpha/beta hydrolase fold domain-containing protein [Chitinophagaceae bacterium]
MKYVLTIMTTMFICIGSGAYAQKWVDTLFQIQQTNDITYDTQTDFAGNTRFLKMNVAVPLNDTVPPCGRPLLIAIHGGAFLAGSKDQDLPPLLMRDFAKRRYVTASIDYRLGMFQTNAMINCNVSMFGIPWNCLNMQDTAEWYRASYRGMQDAKSAIRYLVNHAATYQIDVRNVFLVGESAGGFIALSAAFMDELIEKPMQCSALPDVLPPNAIYENQCIQSTGFDTSIASMNLSRPDLGDITGTGNPSALPYAIKGVGNFYGGMMNELFTHHSYSQAPVLYLYHQPNDLVVPYQDDPVLQGEAYCFTQFPANCQWLVNRPLVYGSKGIKTMIDALNGQVNPLPPVYFDSTLNTADCATQIANPALTGHAVDNYWLRTQHLATFFAPAIDTTAQCTPVAVSDPSQLVYASVYPNPLTGNELRILSKDPLLKITLFDVSGAAIYSALHPENHVLLPVLTNGFYLLHIQTTKGTQVIKICR